MRLCARAVIAIVLVASTAYAGAREEAAAKQAIARAGHEHAAHHYGRAATILSQAESACEPDRCAPSTLAAILRDLGTMQLLNGDEDKARSNYTAALSFDASIELNEAYVTSRVREVWNDVKSPGAAREQPSGDFEHTPASEQKKDIPLPVFVEYHGSAHPASVVVRYAAPGSSSFRRLELAHVGSGWGGVLPCGAVKLGTVRYYFQGLDGEGLPILDGGDKRHPYTVLVKDHIDGPPPHLPGRRAPTMCGEGGEEETSSDAGAAVPSTSTSSKTFARFWIGVSGSIDFTVVPNGNDVCSRDGGTGGPTDPNWTCTSDTPEGIDFPVDNNENGTLVQGKAGNVNSGLEPANVRIKLTFDYAITQNLLVGPAFGFVAGAYQGGIAPRFPPIHLEARATWIFGAEPLSHVGFAPFVQLAGGVAEFDANIAITVVQNNIAGSRPVQAWHVGGPGFVALGGGVRFAFSPRVAMFLSARATAAFGASFFPAFGPELGLQAGL